MDVRAMKRQARPAPHLRDDIDEVIAQWRRERPDLDVAPVAVIGRLSKLARRLEIEFGQGLAAFGISEGEFDVLCALRRVGSPYRLTPSELVETVMISAAGMTKRLDALERAGLIKREPALADRRSMPVALTPRGRRLIDRALTDHLEDEHRLLERLSAKERKELAALLSRLIVAAGTQTQPKRASGPRPGAASRT
jgi:DNA-binding MarR family transcriptional regulator